MQQKSFCPKLFLPQFFIDRTKIVYVSYIRPIIEHSDVVFDNILDSDNKRLNKNQKRAGKIIFGAIKGTAYPTIFSEL